MLRKASHHGRLARSAHIELVKLHDNGGRARVDSGACWCRDGRKVKGARHEGEEDDEERAEHELGGVQIRSSVPKQERNQFTEATNVSQLC